MSTDKETAPHGRDVIYTLAQKGTENSQQRAIILTGRGSEMSVDGYGLRKCKNKTISDSLLLKLIDLAKNDGRLDLQKSLWNSWYCLNKVYTHNGKLYTGKYCKNRFCRNCLGIRKAELINKYHPILRDWEDPHFVTLTVKAFPKKMLRIMLQKCVQGLSQIIDKYEKRAARGNGEPLKGIRTLESNFNPTRGTYNPHLHLIVPNRQTADILVEEWIKKWTYKDPTRKPLADRKGQKVVKIWNMDSALVEVIKYGTKVFTDPEGKKRPIGIVRIYARAYYNIIVAMQGLRLFGSFGFKLPKKASNELSPPVLTTDYYVWEHKSQLQNWVNAADNSLLFEIPTNNYLEELLNWGIDTDAD